MSAANAKKLTFCHHFCTMHIGKMHAWVIIFFCQPLWCFFSFFTENFRHYLSSSGNNFKVEWPDFDDFIIRFYTNSTRSGVKTLKSGHSEFEGSHGTAVGGGPIARLQKRCPQKWVRYWRLQQKKLGQNFFYKGIHWEEISYEQQVHFLLVLSVSPLFWEFRFVGRLWKITFSSVIGGIFLPFYIVPNDFLGKNA